jgi:toxin ParE1/3/4
MRTNYRISDEAIEDLEQFWHYTFKQWSAEQADRYYNLIMDEIEYLFNDFESGRNMDHIKPGYKLPEVKSH